MEGVYILPPFLISPFSDSDKYATYDIYALCFLYLRCESVTL